MGECGLCMFLSVLKTVVVLVSRHLLIRKRNMIRTAAMKVYKCIEGIPTAAIFRWKSGPDEII